MGYGQGLGRGLGTNVRVITPGGFGFRCGSLGWGFSPGVGRISLAKSTSPLKSAFFHATPATPHHTTLKLAFGLGCPILHVSHHVLNSRPTIPQVLKRLEGFTLNIFLKLLNKTIFLF
ncbi:hypothetical protein Hanom_Chr06g00482571 [Helianthus anomalus]